MSEPAVRAELEITFKDGATAGLNATTKAAEQAANKTASAAINAGNKSVEAAEKSASKSVAAVQAQHDAHIKAYKAIASARETLGVRSERLIRDEIKQTEEAYRHLARSGEASARELARAQGASIAKVRELRREMGETEKGFTSLQKLTGIGAAVGAGMMIKPAVTKAIDYDHTVASLTNTMFNERDKAGRIAGKDEIKGAISDALKVGGGTREQAAGTLSALMGSGEFTKDQSYGLLKTIQKGSTATGADSGQLADIALAAKRMGIAPEKIELALSKAIRAGELGGFELSDMAKHLPAILADAMNQGLSGMAGFENTLVSMQSSVLTAGTKDEGANNLRNIFNKLSSQDTAKDFKKHGIDLSVEYVKGALRGEDKMTTFAMLTERVINQNPKMKSAAVELDRLTRLASDKKNPKREDILRQIKQIYTAEGMGTVLQDYQATQGFRAVQAGNKSGLSSRVRDGLAKDDKGQELDTSYGVMSDTASAKLQQLENAKLQGQDAMLTGAGSAIKPFFDGLVGVATEFPVLTVSTSAAASALGLLAASAAANTLLSGGKGADSLIDKTKGAGKFLGNTLAVGVAAELGYNVIGTPVKNGIDSLVQSASGDKNATLGTWLYDLLHSEALKPIEQKPSELHIKQDINLPPGATVKSQSIHVTGNTTLDVATGSMGSVP